MGGHAEPEWVCDQCGCSFNPTECEIVWHYDHSMDPLRVLIYCPNSNCGSWFDICYEMRGKK